MKTAVAFFLASTLLAFTAHAQVSFIPKAGLSLSNIAFDKKQKEQQPTIGVVAGAGFNLPVMEDFLSIQPELLYIQKGYKSEVNFRAIEPDDPIIQSGDYKNRITLTYLELPVLAKISFGSETVKAYVNAGPSFGFCFGGKRKLAGEGRKLETDIKFGKTYDFDNRFDIGAQFGGGIGLQAGPGALLLDVRYGLGFSNLYTTGDNVSKQEAASRHRVVALTIGYAIALERK